MNTDRRTFLEIAAGVGAPALVDPPLRIVNGELTVPSGPGVGIADPSEVLQGAEVVES